MAQDFANTNPADVYAQLTPEQRAAIAQQFIQGMQQSDHPDAQQFAAIDPAAASPQQVADMHEHASKNDKGLLGAVLGHPVATAALGGFAIYEIERHINKK